MHCNLHVLVFFPAMLTIKSEMAMPKKAQSHVTSVDSKIQNTDGMEELENVLLLVRIYF